MKSVGRFVFGWVRMARQLIRKDNTVVGPCLRNILASAIAPNLSLDFHTPSCFMVFNVNLERISLGTVENYIIGASATLRTLQVTRPVQIIVMRF